MHTMTQKRFLIYGAGAVGGWGGVLSRRRVQLARKAEIAANVTLMNERRVVWLLITHLTPVGQVFPVQQ